MNKRELEKRFPSSAQDFLALDIDVQLPIQRSEAAADHFTGDPGPPAIVERDPAIRPVRQSAVQGENSGKFLVRITAVRKILLDEDNLCEKYHVDCCRYAGLIPDDAPLGTSIETVQRNAAEGEAEKVVIDIFRLPRP